MIKHVKYFSVYHMVWWIRLDDTRDFDFKGNSVDLDWNTTQYGRDDDENERKQKKK